MFTAGGYAARVRLALVDEGKHAQDKRVLLIKGKGPSALHLGNVEWGTCIWINK